MKHNLRVFYVEDAQFRATFCPLSNVEFDANLDEYVATSRSWDTYKSLLPLNITLEDIRVISDPSFPEFDEVRHWTPVNTDHQLMDGFVAFGPK